MDEQHSTELTREEMLAVRAAVRYRLVRAMHEHKLTAHIYRKAHKIPEANHEDAEVKLLMAMIHSIDDEDPRTDDMVRLMEECG